MGVKSSNRYGAIIECVFTAGFRPGRETVPFARCDLESAADQLGIRLPKNIGDIIYSVRYRNPLPDSIKATQPKGREWIIEGTGRSSYEFRLVPINRIRPNPQLVRVKIPDSTPEIVSAHCLSDEQALLAIVRYNRLVDVFLGIVANSLQNHLRTTVRGVGQVEIDEIYVGLDKHGCQYVVPVQAKGGCDQISTVQVRQDMRCCKEKFPALVCRPVSAQFLDDATVAMFELQEGEGGDVRILEEKHFRLVPADHISEDDQSGYRRQAGL